MDLIGGYLLVLLILFAANMSLLLGNYKFNNSKLVCVSAGFFIMSTVLMYASNTFLNKSLSFLINYLSYFFLAVSIAIFLAMIYYSRDSRKNLENSIIIIILLAIISIIALSSTAKLSLFEMLTYSLFGFLIVFFTYVLSKLLVHAKREYPVIVREFMCLSAILVFIFALTYNSTLALNYKMFGPFLILTPTYQLIYVGIAVIVGVIIGFVLDENRRGN